jgi:hypothetical protein
MELTQMIGVTVERPSGLAAHPCQPQVAYVAGCAVVLASTGAEGAERYLRRPTVAGKHPKAFTCVAYDPTGRHVAAGEVRFPPCLRSLRRGAGDPGGLRAPSSNTHRWRGTWGGVGYIPRELPATRGGTFDRSMECERSADAPS